MFINSLLMKWNLKKMSLHLFIHFHGSVIIASQAYEPSRNKGNLQILNLRCSPKNSKPTTVEHLKIQSKVAFPTLLVHIILSSTKNCQ